MVFNSTLLVASILLAITVWLGLLSALLIRMISHYNRVTRGVSGSGLEDVLNSLVHRIQAVSVKTEALETATAQLVSDGKSHYQRIGIVRFNPFADTGGAQSFTIAVLDKMNNGLVMTSLYARAGNRWYVKEIQNGKGKDLELSKEESSAIEKAKLGGAASYE